MSTNDDQSPYQFRSDSMQQPVRAQSGQQSPVEGDATGGIIPYKNPKALIAYYLGILSGLPLIGIPVGLAALILGIMGLRDRSRNPVIKGSVHAAIGIGCGGFFFVLWSVVAVIIVIGLVANNR